MKRKILLLLCFLFLLSACGKKGPPMAPVDTTPNSVNDLQLSQKGEKVVLTWSLPRQTVDRTPLAGFREAEVYSYSQSLSSLTTSDQEINFKEIMSSSDWKKTVRKKAEKIFIIHRSRRKQYVTDNKITYEADLSSERESVNFQNLYSFSVKTVSPGGKRSSWSNIVGIIPWPVSQPPLNLKAEVKEEEIELTWDSPQENIDGSQPARLLGYNIYVRSGEDGKPQRKNSRMLFSGPEEWEYSNVSAVEMLSDTEGKNVLQLKVDKGTTSAYLYQDLLEEENLFNLRGKTFDIKLNARILILEEEGRGSILLDDGVNKWGSQNEKEMILSNEWKEYEFTISIDEDATKLTLYIKPTIYPVDVTFQINNVQATLAEEEESEKEEIEKMLDKMLEEEKEAEEAEQEIKPTEEEEEAEPVDLIRNGDFSLLHENKFSDENFEFGKKYTYTIRTVSRLWGIIGESSDSQEMEVTPLDTFPPIPPVGLSAITGAGIVSLSWNVNKEKDLLGYYVYRRAEGESDFTLLTEEPIDKTIYQDDKVIPGRVYIYAVTALDSTEPPNESENSEEITIRAQ